MPDTNNNLNWKEIAYNQSFERNDDSFNNSDKRAQEFLRLLITDYREKNAQKNLAPKELVGILMEMARSKNDKVIINFIMKSPGLKQLLSLEDEDYCNNFERNSAIKEETKTIQEQEVLDLIEAIQGKVTLEDIEKRIKENPHLNEMIIHHHDVLMNVAKEAGRPEISRYFIFIRSNFKEKKSDLELMKEKLVIAVDAKNIGGIIKIFQENRQTKQITPEEFKKIILETAIAQDNAEIALFLANSLIKELKVEIKEIRSLASDHDKKEILKRLPLESTNKSNSSSEEVVSEANKTTPIPNLKHLAQEFTKKLSTSFEEVVVEADRARPTLNESEQSELNGLLDEVNKTALDPKKYAASFGKKLLQESRHLIQDSKWQAVIGAMAIFAAGAVMIAAGHALTSAAVVVVTGKGLFEASKNKLAQTYKTLSDNLNELAASCQRKHTPSKPK